MTVFLLAVYGNVLFTQLTCNLSHLFEATEHHHEDSEDSAHNHIGSDKHNQSKDDDCCNDKTAAFFASQTNLDIPSLKVKNAFFEKIIFSPNALVHITIPYHSVGYFSYRELPPKIPDIKIFLHSFLI